MALAGLVGLTGVMLLTLAQPIAPSFHDRWTDRWSVRRAVEVRAAAYDAPPDASEEDAWAPARKAAAVIKPVEIEDPPPPPARSPEVEQAAPAPVAFRDRLAEALRSRDLACLGGREVLLSPTERELCRETLGALGRKASFGSTLIAPDKRAFYDAVAQAQAPRRAIVPLSARGAGGAFNTDDRPRSARGPRIGCAMRFGPNADMAPDEPAEALRAGPCFLRPPGGR